MRGLLALVADPGRKGLGSLHAQAPVTAVPLECPQLLGGGRASHGVIKVSNIHSSAVPRHRKVHGFLVVTRPLSIVGRGLVLGSDAIVRATTAPHGVEKDWDFRHRIGHIHASPVIFLSPSLNIGLGVVAPVVAPITTDQKFGARLKVIRKVREIVGGVGPSQSASCCSGVPMGFLISV